MADFNSLVDSPISVPEVRRLRVTEMNAKALSGTAEDHGLVILDIGDDMTYKPMARAKLTIPLSVRTAAELTPEMTT